jgi:hypothetical protein
MMTTDVATGAFAAKLEIGIGVTSHAEPDQAVARAAALAAARLNGAAPDLAIVLTAGLSRGNVLPGVRSVLGSVGIAGGVTPALLTDHGAMTEGALVICIANADGGTSGVAATSGPSLADAGQAAARLVLAGWPFRARYPRGLGLAFARAAAEGSSLAFLDCWRDFMGPKMRTVCSVLGDAPLYGCGDRSPLASVACLEAPYATGLGFAEEGGLDSAAEAMLTAVKRLDGRPPRLVLVAETVARYEALGEAAPDEWAVMRGQLEESTPCVGWLTTQVAGYGRGVQPADSKQALIVVAIGDSPRG